MRRLPFTIYALAASAPFAPPAFAHHSQAMFDTTKEILVEGTIARLDWVNPHMYMIVNTKGPDGQPAQVEGEGLGITQALVDGLERDELKPGTHVVMRANPNRGGWGKQVRIMDVTTQDGEWLLGSDVDAGGDQPSEKHHCHSLFFRRTFGALES